MNILLVCLLLLPWTANAAVLFSVDYEDGTYGAVDTCSGAQCPSGFQSVPNAQAIAQVTTPVRAGTRAAENLARPDWGANGTPPCYLFGIGPVSNDPGCDRSEFEKVMPYTPEEERWYGFSVYIDPATVYTQSSDPNGPLLFQLHELGGTCGSGFGPRLALWFKISTGHWEVQHDADATLPCATTNTKTRRKYDGGPWSKGVWTDFVFHIKWSVGSTGLLQVWKDGVQFVNFTGLTSFQGFTREDVKWGVYQSWWGVQAPPAGDRMVVYHDHIKVGDENSNYAEVAPPVVGPPAVGPPAVGPPAGGLPPTTNAWFAIPNSTVQPLCPTDTDTFGECKYIPIAWGSAALDQGRGWFLIHGGGHNNYYGNEIYKLDLTQAGLAGSLTRVVGPSTPIPASTEAPDCIGTPCVSNSKHLYDGMVWMDLLGKALVIGGSPAKNGGFANSIWLMDPSQATAGAIWRRLTADYAVSGSGGGGSTQVIGIAPAKNRDKVWSCASAEWRKADGTLAPIVYCFDQLNLYSIDPVANVMRSLTNRSTVVPFYMTAAYDAKRQVFVLLGGSATTFATFTLTGGPEVQVPGSGDASLVARPKTGAEAIAGTTAPGVVYDPDLDRVVAWGTSAALNTFFVADMDKALANAADTWSTCTVTGAPNPAIETDNHGINKRFNYWKQGRMYIYEGSTATNMWAARLAAPDNTP